jgi:hypothetical protein
VGAEILAGWLLYSFMFLLHTKATIRYATTLLAFQRELRSQGGEGFGQFLSAPPALTSRADKEQASWRRPEWIRVRLT